MILNSWGKQDGAWWGWRKGIPEQGNDICKKKKNTKARECGMYEEYQVASLGWAEWGYMRKAATRQAEE